MVSGSPVSGKVFYADAYALYVERDYLLLKKIGPAKESGSYLIEKADKKFDTPFAFRTEIRSFKAIQPQLIKTSEAYLDASKLSFPLILRKWRHGDRFQPLGMKGTKLLSDFFTDEKFSKISKDNAWVLESAGVIAWLVGYRIDDRFKTVPSTKEIFLTSLG